MRRPEMMWIQSNDFGETTKNLVEILAKKLLQSKKIYVIICMVRSVAIAMPI